MKVHPDMARISVNSQEDLKFATEWSRAQVDAARNRLAALETFSNGSALLSIENFDSCKNHVIAIEQILASVAAAAEFFDNAIPAIKNKVLPEVAKIREQAQDEFANLSEIMKKALG